MALLPDLPEVCFVEVGDFTGAALRRGRRPCGLDRVVFVGMVGKLTKLAAGVLMTHYTRSKVDLGLLGASPPTAGGDRRRWPRRSPPRTPPATPTSSGSAAGLLRPGRRPAVPAGRRRAAARFDRGRR